MNRDLKALSQKLGYRFREISLLDTALTHSSYANERGVSDNERLEFLGDSILNFVVANKLFFDTDETEGKMTDLRKASVSREPLAVATDELELIKYMRFGEGEKGDRPRSPKFKSDVFEAVVGAIFADSRSLAECEKFILSRVAVGIKKEDSKSELQEYVQGKKIGFIEYDTKETVSAPKSEFKSEVRIGGEIYGSGIGFSKKAAEKAAAKRALEKLRKIDK